MIKVSLKSHSMDFFDKVMKFPLISVDFCPQNATNIS